MVALLFVGFISYENTIQFIQRDSLDDRINLIIQRLEHLVSDVTDAEIGQRGYIITDVPNYLQPYNSALRDIHGQLANLDMMIANEPSNQRLSLKDLNILKDLIEAKLAELNQTIALRQSHGFNAALPIILSNRGKIVMDKIRATALDIENQQKDLLTMYTSIASSLAIFLVYKLKFHGLHGKTHAAVAAGLVLWLSADIVWAIYQIVLDIVPPMPSAADYLWLCGYGFLAYYLFMTYKEFQKEFNFGRKVLVVSIIGNAIFLSYIIALTANLSVLTSSKGIQMFAFLVAYPILDSVLMIPAIVILVEFRKEPVSFTPWICETLGIFLVAISDSWFAVIVLTSLVEQVWLSAVFFAAHLLVMAAGLLWYVNLLSRSVPTHEVSRKEVPTKIAPSSSTRKETGKVRVQTIAIAGGALFASVLFGVVLYPSSPLNALFTNTKAEVIAPPNDGKKIVALGALLPLTGVWSTVGESENAALKIAVKYVNQYLSESNSNIRIGLMVEDTRTDPAVSLEKLQDLASKGVRIVIGPATSTELDELQYYADQKGIMLISPSGTAPSLAVVGNNVYRFASDDTYQAQAISRLMWQEGVRVVIPMWRTDIDGNELEGLVREEFEKLGGTVLPGIGYVPDTGDFSSSLNRINFIMWSQDLRSLASKVSQAVTHYGADKVGVYLVAFDEVAPIFIGAQNLPVLSTVKWFGSDDSVLNYKLVKNMDAASFAVKTGFVNPIYAVDNKSYKLKLIDNQIQEMIGRVPSTYAEVTYDAFWVAALTENATLGTKDINDLKKTFVRIANSYTGITGDTSLNEAGDRKHGDYDFWAIKPSNSTNNNFVWTKVGRTQMNVSNKHAELVKNNTIRYYMKARYLITR